MTLTAVRSRTTIERAIGNTPLVELPSFSPAPGVRIWAKLEGANPSGSVKDRIALAMFEAAEADGELYPGIERVIIEPTSGNTGIAMAMLARRRGYRFLAVLPENVSVERRQLLELYGAQLDFTPGELGSNGAIRRAQQLVNAHPERFYMPYQYGNAANPGAHYATTAPEILRDLPEITHFVAGLGTTGTVVGTGRYLHERDPHVRVVAVEPDEPLHGLEGLKHLPSAIVPEIWDEAVPDERVSVSTESALLTCEEVMATNGLFIGHSAGAAVFAARERARGLRSGVVVALLCDGGERYLAGRR